MQRVLERFAFLSRIARRVKQSLMLLRIIYDRKLASGFRQVGRVFFAVSAMIGFGAILYLVLLLVILWFNPRTTKDAALYVLGGMAGLDGVLMMIGVDATKRPKRTRGNGAGAAGRETDASRGFDMVAAGTLLSLGLSALSALVSISYLGEYASLASFAFPLYLMLWGVMGIIYLFCA